jgi:NAD+ diphosphatase
MALSFFQNTFAGNPLDRASDRRTDTEWLAGQLASSDSLGLALWNGKPFIEKTKEGR